MLYGESFRFFGKKGLRMGWMGLVGTTVQKLPKNTWSALSRVNFFISNTTKVNLKGFHFTHFCKSRTRDYNPYTLLDKIITYNLKIMPWNKEHYFSYGKRTGRRCRIGDWQLLLGASPWVCPLLPSLASARSSPEPSGSILQVVNHVTPWKQSREFKELLAYLLSSLVPNNTDGSLSNTAPAFHDSLNLSGNGHVPVADDDIAAQCVATP